MPRNERLVAFVDAVLADPPTSQEGWLMFARAIRVIDFDPTPEMVEAGYRWVDGLLERNN